MSGSGYYKSNAIILGFFASKISNANVPGVCQLGFFVFFRGLLIANTTHSIHINEIASTKICPLNKCHKYCLKTEGLSEGKPKMHIIHPRFCAPHTWQLTPHTARLQPARKRVQPARKKLQPTKKKLQPSKKQCQPARKNSGGGAQDAHCAS